MKLSAIVSLLVAANASPQVILEAVLAWEKSNDEALTIAREKTTARWHRWKANKEERLQTNVSKRLPTATNNSCAGDARGIVTSSKKEITGKESKEEVKNALRAVLREEQADAVIEHRKALRKPLTLRAAQLLAGAFSKAPNPNSAADAMIANGWQGFDASWLQKKSMSGNGQKTYADLARERMNGNGPASLRINHHHAQLVSPDEVFGHGDDDGDLRGRPAPRLIGSNH